MNGTIPGLEVETRGAYVGEIDCGIVARPFESCARLADIDSHGSCVDR